jgi:hypothetical protein
MVNYSFHWRPVFEALPDMHWGCLVTIEIALLATAIGIVFGIALALARTNGGKVASGFDYPGSSSGVIRPDSSRSIWPISGSVLLVCTSIATPR